MDLFFKFLKKLDSESILFNRSIVSSDGTFVENVDDVVGSMSIISLSCSLL